ncbi:[NiFe]-hydrogenase assembly chaperone HybE [Rhodoplanes roseus]|uniref:Hydrogenase formation protein HupJ n=1 Tax=Rhodoplanes roseus TaxID=29409 RepID=A0A327KYD9_9BRAD|nr:[NiFe]-hydrogenase assembly chaperone HybE [Rhodoplanes roseus]RAI43096.1 hypothetical protein CH341_16025 [Rhodoplanes roseus]
MPNDRNAPPPDPAIAVGEGLAAAYRAVAARMRDLPVYNPRLAVEAVGFRTWEGVALGVMVTPWFMNLVLAVVPGGPALPDARVGDSREVRFPAGTIAFTVGALAGVRRLDAASLFSPMAGFDAPESAREAAAAALAAVLDQPPADTDRVSCTAPPPAPRDRRALLFGRGAS